MLLLEHEEELANVAGGTDTVVARGKGAQQRMQLLREYSISTHPRE
jgi:hypothetical protein